MERGAPTFGAGGTDRERPPEREHDPLRAIEALHADVLRTEHLRALWEKFGSPPEPPPPDVAGVTVVARDFRDAEALLRAPEIRGHRSVEGQLVHRLTSYFAEDQSLWEFLAHARSLKPGASSGNVWNYWTPPSARSELHSALAWIPPGAGRLSRDAFVATPREPFGVLDSDARDAVLAGVAKLPTADARRDALLRCFDIDVNAVLQQLDHFALRSEDRAEIFRHAAAYAPDVLPPYLPQLAEEHPDLARALLDTVIAHGLLAGADAIARFPFTPAERREREEQLAAAHPVDAIANRAALARFLTRTTIGSAMEVAFAHLERELPRDPIARLTALDALAHDDADITDRLTPMIRAALRDTLGAVREPLDALRRDVAEIRKVPVDKVVWSYDIFDELGWERKAHNEETRRIARTRRALGPPRVRTLAIAAFAQSINEHPFVGHGDAAITPTERFAVVEEAIADNRVTGPRDRQEEWTEWAAFASPPRTPRERATTRELLRRLAEVSPTDFVVASITASRTAKDLAEHLPALRAVAPEHLERALSITDGGPARIFANADRATARWIVDAVFGSDEHPEDRMYLIACIPSKFQPLLLRHIDRYRTRGVMPYAAFPDAALALRALNIGTAPTSHLSELPEPERAEHVAEFGALFARHRSRGMRALAAMAGQLDGDALRRGVFRTVHTLLNALPDAFLPEPVRSRATGRRALPDPLRGGVWGSHRGQRPLVRASSGKDAVETPGDAQWNRIAAFIPFCPPERVRELLTVWAPLGPRLERRPNARARERSAAERPDSSVLLLAFRLREDPEQLMARCPFLTARDTPFSKHAIAFARRPDALLTLLGERGDEIASFLGNRDTRDRFVSHIAGADDPATAWAFIKRFADSYGTMIPEPDRRAAITLEMVLRESASWSIAGSIRYAVSDRRAVPIAHAGAREFTHPTFTDGRLDLTSLTAPELERLIRDRLDALFVEDPNDRLRADAANRSSVEHHQLSTAQLPAGTLIHYTSVDVLPAILAEANCCGETVGIESTADSFPLFVDVLRIREHDAAMRIPDIFAHPEYHEEYAWFDHGVALVYPRRGDPAARFHGEEAPARDRLDIHHLCFVGIPNSELGAIILTNEVAADAFDDVLERTKAAVVKSGMYVPIVRADGEILFTPQGFDAREAAAHPYGTLADLLDDAAALAPLDRPQPSAAHEFTLQRHLLEAERNAIAFAEEFGVPPEYRALVRTAARLHDIGKFEAAATGQEIANVVAAERELAKVRALDPEVKRQILVLIRHDELLGDILKETTIGDDGTAVCTPDAERTIAEFHDRFPLPLHRTLLRVLYEADVRAIGNGMHERWQVREKLAALADRLFP